MRHTIRSAALLAVIAGLPLAARAQIAFSRISYDTPTRPDAVALGDWDRDGAVDIAVATDDPDKISVLFNTGNGEFAGPTVFTLPSGGAASELGAGDFDADGDLDIAVALRTVSRVLIMVNVGGAFARGPVTSVGTEPRDMEVADLNGDSLPDLVTANRQGSITVLIGTGMNMFTPTTVPVPGEPRGIALGDYNRDGRTDVAVTQYADRTVRVYPNGGGGGFGQFLTLTADPSSRPDGVLFADLTGDGYPELVVASTRDTDRQNLVSVFANNAGTFGARTDQQALGTDATSLDPSPLVALDADGDADLDIATTNEGSNTIALFPNTGGVLGAPVVLASAIAPTSLGVGRLDPNTSDDLVVTDRGSSLIGVYRNANAGPAPGCDPDYNRDGAGDLTDVLDLADDVAGGTQSFPPSTPDFNDDGAIDLSDVFDIAGVVAGGVCP